MGLADERGGGNGGNGFCGERHSQLAVYVPTEARHQWYGKGFEGDLRPFLQKDGFEDLPEKEKRERKETRKRRSSKDTSSTKDGKKRRKDSVDKKKDSTCGMLVSPGDQIAGHRCPVPGGHRCPISKGKPPS